MTSCEPHHCSAYAENLRWRIVWRIKALQYTNEQVANNLGVDNILNLLGRCFGGRGQERRPPAGRVRQRTMAKRRLRHAD